MPDQHIGGTASTCGCYRTVTRDEHGTITDIDEGFCADHWRQLVSRIVPPELLPTPRLRAEYPEIAAQMDREREERLRAMQYDHAGMDTEYADHTPDRYYDEED